MDEAATAGHDDHARREAGLIEIGAADLAPDAGVIFPEARGAPVDKNLGARISLALGEDHPLL